MYINGAGPPATVGIGALGATAGAANLQFWPRGHALRLSVYAWWPLPPLVSLKSTTSGAPLLSSDGRTLSRPEAGGASSGAGSGAALVPRPKQPHHRRDSSWLCLPLAAAATARSVADSFVCAFSGRSGSSLEHGSAGGEGRRRVGWPAGTGWGGQMRCGAAQRLCLPTTANLMLPANSVCPTAASLLLLLLLSI